MNERRVCFSLHIRGQRLKHFLLYQVGFFFSKLFANYCSLKMRLSVSLLFLLHNYRKLVTLHWWQVCERKMDLLVNTFTSSAKSKASCGCSYLLSSTQSPENFGLLGCLQRDDLLQDKLCEQGISPSGLRQMVESCTPFLVSRNVNGEALSVVCFLSSTFCPNPIMA